MKKPICKLDRAHCEPFSDVLHSPVLVNNQISPCDNTGLCFFMPSLFIEIFCLLSFVCLEHASYSVCVMENHPPKYKCLLFKPVIVALGERSRIYMQSVIVTYSHEHS